MRGEESGAAKTRRFKTSKMIKINAVNPKCMQLYVSEVYTLCFMHTCMQAGEREGGPSSAGKRRGNLGSRGK